MATVAEFNLKLQESIKILEAQKPLELATLTIVAMRQKRIFQDGLDSNNSKIGNYNSTDKITIAEKNSPVKFGKKYKQFDSYKDFRSSIGRESGFVNLRLTNELQSDLGNIKMDKTANEIGEATAIKVSNFEYKSVLKDLSIKKKEGAEDHFKTKIFAHTKEEKEQFFKILRLENARMMANLLK